MLASIELTPRHAEALANLERTTGKKQADLLVHALENYIEQQMVAEYVGEQSAVRYISEFNRLIDLAAYNPLMGKIGVVPNTRELYPINGK